MMETKKKVDFTEIPLDLLDMNEGQIEGLPRNPRQWSWDEVQRLAKSIEETPGLIEARGMIVLPYEGRYVVLGGNMRLTALRYLGWQNGPCIIVPEDTPLEDLEAIVIKDNGEFGKWDRAKFKTDWQDCPFADWGIDVFDFGNEDLKKEKVTDQIPDGKTEYSIVLSADEFAYVNNALRELNPDSPEQAFLGALGYYDGTE